MKQKVVKTFIIDGLTPKGYGFSNLCEIPKTLPGEEVEAELVKRDRASLISVLKPSLDRVTPRCSHFSICGGCKLQHLEPLAQSAWKEGEVRNKFSQFDAQFLPILVSDHVYEWRNKMEFSFSEDKHQNRYLGLMMQEGRSKVFNIERCHLAAGWMSELLKEVRGWWSRENISAYEPHKDAGSLRSLILREGITTKDRMIILHVSGRPEYALDKRQIDAFREIILKFTPEEEDSHLSGFLMIQQAIKGQVTQFFEMQLAGKDVIRERMLGFLFLISPRSFFQPNTLQAAKLYQAGIDLLNLKGNEVVYDLYCGTGTLGMIASKYASQVIGVDLSKEACLDATQNLAINKISNVKIFNGDVAAVLQGDFPKADVVMVDPPRVGLSKEAIQEILKLNPSKILYISCNFNTCAMNVPEFIAAGYHLEYVQPVDQFPHTYHVETIILLTKTNY